ncbi:MAG: hypothetical protein HMLKMBBP_02670 [Planctomycetes bacterium]|nr:hypothetical protein [Planctomycetota bacterium]
MSFGGSILAGLSAVRRSKRLLGLSAVSTALLSLPAAAWVGRRFHEAAAHRPDAVDLARSLDLDVLFDVKQGAGGFDADLTALVVAALVPYFVLRPLVLGGYCGVAATDRRLPFATFVREGGIVYWKFLRIALIGLLGLWGASLAAKPLIDTFDGFAKSAGDEGAAARYRLFSHVVAVGILFVPRLVMDYARVGVRIHRTPGVLRQTGRAALFVVSHPFRTVGVFLVARGFEIAAVLLFLPLLRAADGAYLTTTAVVVLLSTALVALREASAMFHVAAAYHLRRADETAPPPAPRSGEDGPDILEAPLPWRDS